MGYTEESLYKRLVELKTNAKQIAEDIKAIKKDFTFDAELNTKGLDKQDVKLIDKAAALWVKNNFFETEEETLAIFAKYKELSGED